MTYTIAYTKILTWLGTPIYLHNSNQKNKQKSINLNSFAQYSKYLNFSRFLINNLVRSNHKRKTITMCDKDKLYYRINKDILPSFVYWHLVQDFTYNKVEGLAGKRFLGVYKFASHPIYNKTIGHFGVFVKYEKQANLSIGSYRYNFGEVTLLRNTHF